jgi:hypothetical protein
MPLGCMTLVKVSELFCRELYVAHFVDLIAIGAIFAGERTHFELESAHGYMASELRCL